MIPGHVVVVIQPEYEDDLRDDNEEEIGESKRHMHA